MNSEFEVAHILVDELDKLHRNTLLANLVTEVAGWVIGTSEVFLIAPALVGEVSSAIIEARETNFVVEAGRALSSAGVALFVREV